MPLPVQRFLPDVVAAWARAEADARRALASPPPEPGVPSLPLRAVDPGRTEGLVMVVSSSGGRTCAYRLGEWGVVREGGLAELVVRCGPESVVIPEPEGTGGGRETGRPGAVSPGQEALLSAMARDYPALSMVHFSRSLARGLSFLEGFGMTFADFERELGEWAVGSVLGS